MTAREIFDVISLAAALLALAGVFFNRRHRVPGESLQFLFGIAVLALLREGSELLASSGVTAMFTSYTTSLEIVSPVLWFFFVYSFVRAKQAERIKDNEEQLRVLYEDLPDALFLVNAESGRIQDANQAASSLLGRPLGEIIGLHQSDLHPPELKESSRERFSEFRRQAEQTSRIGPIESLVLRSDGERVPVEISARFIQVSGEPVLQALFHDISPHRRAAELLRREKEQAQMYLDVAGVAFISLDREGGIQLINRRGLEILGYSSDRQLLGRDWFETCVPEHARGAARAIFERQVAGEAPFEEHSEGAALTRTGDERLMAWHNTLLRQDEEILGMLSSGEDITQQRLAEYEKTLMESQLRQGQKLESIGTLATGVAHEINNPLTGIINYAQLIYDRTEGDMQRKYASEILHEGNRVAKIVRNLLAFSYKGDDSQSLARVEDVVDSTLSLIGAALRKDQVQLSVDISPNLPRIRCRAHEIEQVLLNLLTNARDALNERYAEYDENKILKITVDRVAHDSRSWIRIVVEDHGKGISAEDIDRIFDPFFSTKTREKGTGLGLFVSYGLIRDHHGRLGVESKPGIYTRFIVELPAAQDERENRERDSQREMNG